MSQSVIERQYKDFKLSKVDPASATIYDILNDVKANRFIIRPNYQRTEVTDKQKASYLIERVFFLVFVFRQSLFSKERIISLR